MGRGGRQFFTPKFCKSETPLQKKKKKEKKKRNNNNNKTKQKSF